MEKSPRSSALYEQGWSLRTLELTGEFRLSGWSVVAPDLLRRADGSLLWILNGPTRRTRFADGWFEVEDVEWNLAQEGDVALLRTADTACHVDAVELRGEVAGAFEADTSEPMHLYPLGGRLGGPRDLAPFLLEDQVVARADGRVGPTEQLALSIYRIARLRGGPFWDAAAAHVAAAVRQRVEMAGARAPRHGLWAVGETHVRLLADTLLLLVAHSEATGDPRCSRAGEAIADMIEGFGVRWGGGVWYLHDSAERQAGRNDLVLNTHLHAMLALLAAGRSVDSARRSLVSALGLRCRRPGAYLHAAAIAATDAAGALTPAPGSRAGLRRAMRSRGRGARYRVRHPHLRAPGGWIAQSVHGRACPLRYMLVNLHDLAMLQANLDEPASKSALRVGLRYVRLTGFVRAQRRRGDPTVALVPGILRVAGRERAAESAAARLAAHGLPPAVGWPGHEDHLWSRLAAGTP